MDHQHISRDERDIVVLRKQARRRLIGAFVLAFIAVCFLPFMFHPPTKQGTETLAFVIHYPYGNVCSYVRDWERLVSPPAKKLGPSSVSLHSSSRALTLKPTGHNKTLLVTPVSHHEK